jgi:hypothetical protein
MLATLRAVAPSGPQWAHEIKWDGYRMVAIIEQGRVSLYLRRGLDWAGRMPGIVEALGKLDVRSAVIDGEAVIIDEDGMPDFSPIHADLAAGHAPSATFIARPAASQFPLLDRVGVDAGVAATEEPSRRMTSAPASTECYQRGMLGVKHEDPRHATRCAN